MPDDQPIHPHDPWADYYDCVYKLTFGERYQQFTDRTLGVIQELAAPPARIIEFGAGTGRLAIPLAQLGSRVTAVEASASMCDVLRAKAQAGVEGAVVRPCAACRSRSVPEAKQGRVELEIFNQTICERLPVDGFDLGTCVFTVLNYLVDEPRLRQFAAVAVGAIRPGGRLLVSFVEDMRPMQRCLNDRQKEGKSPDGRCSLERNVNIRHVGGRLFEYHEAFRLNEDGQQRHGLEKPFPPFLLREWSQAEIIEAFEAAGFSKEADLSSRFSETGEAYLLFRRSPDKPDPWTVPPDWEGPFPPPKTTRIILDLKPGTEGDV